MIDDTFFDQDQLDDYDEQYMSRQSELRSRMSYRQTDARNDLWLYQVEVADC